jgi:hypothetical protein
MRRLWSFIASYPPAIPQAHRRRIPVEVAEDLRWWSLLLPKFNGVLFFDNKSRPIFHLFTDASQVGLGGFWYLGLSPNFMTIVPSTPRENSFAQRLKRDLLQTFDITESRNGSVAYNHNLTQLDSMLKWISAY